MWSLNTITYIPIREGWESFEPDTRRRRLCEDKTERNVTTSQCRLTVDRNTEPRNGFTPRTSAASEACSNESFSCSVLRPALGTFGGFITFKIILSFSILMGVLSIKLYYCYCSFVYLLWWCVYSKICPYFYWVGFARTTYNKLNGLNNRTYCLFWSINK